MIRPFYVLWLQFVTYRSSHFSFDTLSSISSSFREHPMHFAYLEQSGDDREDNRLCPWIGERTILYPFDRHSWLWHIRYRLLPIHVGVFIDPVFLMKETVGRLDAVMGHILGFTVLLHISVFCRNNVQVSLCYCFYQVVACHKGDKSEEDAGEEIGCY